MKSADDDGEELRLSTFLRCVVRHEMFRRIQRRIGKSSARTSEHEFERVRVDRLGTSS